jgi:hypothetical protein
LDKITRKNYFLNLLRYNLTGVYTAKGLGYDRALVMKKNISRIQGYFQTHKYYNYLLSSGCLPALELYKKSKWFTDLYSILISKQVVVVHIRRGDYNKLASSIGLLSRDYYISAISQIQSILPNSELWIFSDEINEAKELLYGINLEISKWVIPPDGNDPAESLVLMSHGKAIITANSSFSWWAAATGNNLKTVITPYPWFKNLEEPENLIPEHWIRVPSSWK